MAAKKITSRKTPEPAAHHHNMCCLVNANAGTAGASPGEVVAAAFKTHGVLPHIIEVQEGDDIHALTRQALAQGHKVMVSGGGDGTVNAVASCVIGQKGITFGVLPMGTYNHFAKDLVIPLDLAAAAGVIVAGHTRAIDVGSVNGHIFVNNSSVGIYPAMVRLRVALQKSGYRKSIAAAWAALRILARFPRLRIALHSADASLPATATPMIFVGNNRYAMDLAQWGTRPSLQDGKLWVMVSSAAGRLAMLRSLLSVLWSQQDVANVIFFETDRFRVTTRHRYAKVAVDGEVLRLTTPLDYEIRPHALQVIVAK